jgi:hypothetical protein
MDADMGGYFRDPHGWITRYPVYETCGDNCRAAMILHECGHFVANAKHFAREGPTLNGTADFPDGKDKPLHPRNYAQLTPDEAAHNACTYAAFAYHAATGQDGRPGADRINF